METQRTKEWFAKRRGRVTGSNVGAILGCDPYRKPKDVMRAMVRDHHGAETEFKGNVATEHGVFYEDYAQNSYELEYDVTVKETGFHPFDEWLGASPDGLVGDDTVLEIKCPFGKRNEANPVFKWLAEMPHYYAQIQIEMLCTGRTKCHFYQWTAHGNQLEIVGVDDEWLDLNLPILRAFYEQFLIECENPDKYLGAEVAIIENRDLADKYRNAKEQMEKFKELMAYYKSDLVIAAGGEKASIDGLLVYPIEKKGNIAYAKVVKEHLPDLDLEPYRGKASTSWGVK